MGVPPPERSRGWGRVGAGGTPSGGGTPANAGLRNDPPPSTHTEYRAPTGPATAQPDSPARTTTQPQQPPQAW
ncbi:hypothetical protein B7767_17890 [Streptomyces sp. 13-12-16]|nr:hypothetical protein B7767_17890 [Streptomyces sp. 13-12-16]